MPPEVLHELWRAGMTGVCALLLTGLLTPAVRFLAVRYGWVARPSEDRWGKRVVAQLGGIAMYGGFVGASLVGVRFTPLMMWLMLGVSLVFMVGLWDDLRRMPPYTKLVAQLLVGCVLVVGGLRFQLPHWHWASIPLSVLWFVLIMNAFNLLDNMDGLAASIGAIAAGFCALHAAMIQQWPIVTLAMILCGCCVGFLGMNAPPAKIYMGDSGSHFLGLSLSALSVLGTWRHPTQLLSVLAIPALVLAVPIFDTCFVAIQRLRYGQHPFVGGTDHVSHRLALLGLSTRRTVGILSLGSVCLGVLSILTARLTPLSAFAVWLTVVTVFLLIGRYLARVNVYRIQRDIPTEPSPEEGRALTLIETMLMHKRRLLEIMVDFFLVSSAYVVAHLLRYEGTLSTDIEQLIVRSLPLILVIKLGCFAGCGLYRGVWRYVGLADILRIARASILGSVFSSVALLLLWRFEGYSRAVLVIDGILTFLALSSSRVVERFLDEWIHAMSKQGVPTVLIGAGDTAELVLRALRYERAPGRRVVALLDDDARMHGSLIHGCPVIGGRERLGELLAREGVREVLIAISDPPGGLLQHVRSCCEPLGVPWRVVTAGVMAAHE